MSRKTPQKTYTAEFRKEAVKMIQEQQSSYRAEADKLPELIPESFGIIKSMANPE